MIKLDIEDVTVTADLAVQGVIEGEMSASDDDEIYIEQVGGTRDYEKLENLPKLCKSLHFPLLFLWNLI